MPPKPLRYTATMAKIFADQGYLRKAAEIYRWLIAQSPEREDLREALAAIERHWVKHPAPSSKDIELLLREWSEMVRAQNKQCTRGRSTDVEEKKW